MPLKNYSLKRRNEMADQFGYTTSTSTTSTSTEPANYANITQPPKQSAGAIALRLGVGLWGLGALLAGFYSIGYVASLVFESSRWFLQEGTIAQATALITAGFFWTLVTLFSLAAITAVTYGIGTAVFEMTARKEK
jgi:pheromone shutdown protein TraB